MIPASSIDPAKIATLDRDKIRQVKQATRDKQTCAMLLYLVFITAPVTLPLFIRAVRKYAYAEKPPTKKLSSKASAKLMALRKPTADAN